MNAETPILDVLSAGGFPALIRAFDRVTSRSCADCGTEFEAVGFQAYCDPCGIKVDEAAALPPLRKLDSSWPRLQADKLTRLRPCEHGPKARCGTCMAQDLAPRLFGNRMLVLAGDRGRGKTQIATYCAWHRMTKGHDSGLYVRAFDMAQRVSGLDKIKALVDFQRVPFLCLDEVHRLESKYIPILESIVDDRYANKRPTVIIGNWLTTEGIQDGETVSGQKLNGIGPTLMDRINEHVHARTGGIVWCKWASYRTA